MALYHELVNNLTENIKKMEIGEKLPSERQLCLDYDVSRTTVRSAISELELRGYVKRIQGNGTFVTKPKFKRQNLSNYYSFTEQTRMLGREPKTIIIEYHIDIPSDYILEKMKLEKDSLVISFVRLRLADDEKMMLETSYVPYLQFKELTRPLLDELPLYEIFEKRYNKKIHKVNEVFSVTNLNATQAKLLDTVANNPALKINRTSYDKDKNVIEYSISLASGDKFNYETTYYPN